MEQQQYSKLFSFLWNIANDVLVQAFDPSEYKKITLPFIVLRRLDLLLEDTKERVINLSQSEEFKMLPEESQEQQLYLITGHPFFNTSRFTMSNLRAETDSTRLHQNFLAYLDGFSHHVQDIIEKFEVRHFAERLSALNPPRLGAMLNKVTDEQINLGLNPVLDENGKEKLPGLDNHTMGTLFEELIRKFNETYSITDAGLHYTPRDYVAMLTELAILPVVDKLKNGSYEIYDGACGTGGILSLAQERFMEIGKEKGKRFKTYLYGQELMPETYATCEADLMLSGSSTNFYYNQNGVSRSRFSYGSTISQDGHPGKQFDFCISNPPFGTPWKNDLDNWGISNKKDIKDSRFYGNLDDDTLSFIPDIGDPQMLFLANNISRMKEDEQGTRIVEIHNGSSLFTGNAGGGESNLRRYIIENDMLEAIIAMPLNMFYNTPIGTYIWIVTNRKDESRRGKVQLVDASNIFSLLRKNLGSKNCEVSEENRKSILNLLMNFDENEQSKIFDNREFGYWQITVRDHKDKKAKDTEQVPLLYEGGIDAFMQNEVLPYAPNAYVEESKTVIGYELSFTKYFSKPFDFRTFADIESDIRKIESDTDGLLDEILNYHIETDHLITNGLNPNAPMKDSGIPWIGKIPAHWDVRRIKWLFKEEDTRNIDLKYELLSFSRSKGIVPFSEINEKEPSANDLSKYKVIKPGQLLENRMQAWSGMFGCSHIEGCVSPDYAVFSAANDEVNVEYYATLFRTKLYIQQFANASRGVGDGFNRLYTPAFGAIYAHFPPAEEQQAIVDEINFRSSKIDLMVSKLNDQITYLKELKQRIISDAVTGKIDVEKKIK
jgi:type I restriction enzyme M protein